MIAGLEKLRMPEAVRMRLGEAEFLVTLPTRWNKGYHREWQSKLGEKVKLVDGKADMSGLNPAEMMEYQLLAFVKHCIVEAPQGSTPELLMSEYYPATEALFNEAKKLADEAEAQAEAAVGKSATTSPGANAGEAS
jgi:hypothetical protein